MVRKCKVRYKNRHDYGAEWVEAEGFFHRWAAAYEEFEGGPGNFTVAIVELGDGKVVEVSPENLQFLDPLKAIEDAGRREMMLFRELREACDLP